MQRLMCYTLQCIDVMLYSIFCHLQIDGKGRHSTFLEAIYLDEAGRGHDEEGEFRGQLSADRQVRYTIIVTSTFGFIPIHAKSLFTPFSSYFSLNFRASSNDHLMTSRQIEKDLLRTLPTNVCYSTPKSIGVPRLRRILRGLAWLYPDIGYCQVT